MENMQDSGSRGPGLKSTGLVLDLIILNVAGTLSRNAKPSHSPYQGATRCLCVKCV